MTTTMVGVGSLSPDLDSNFTVPLTTVYSNPTFSENVTGGSETFSLVFNFTNPFLYDPAQGNLLFDLLISGQNVALSFSRSGSGINWLGCHIASQVNGIDVRSRLNCQDLKDESCLRAVVALNEKTDPRSSSS